MRKTSGFFKRKFAPNYPQGSESTGDLPSTSQLIDLQHSKHSTDPRPSSRQSHLTSRSDSGPVSPIFHDPHLPPVPNIPSSYMLNSLPSASSTASDKQSQLSKPSPTQAHPHSPTTSSVGPEDAHQSSIVLLSRSASESYGPAELLPSAISSLPLKPAAINRPELDSSRSNDKEQKSSSNTNKNRLLNRQPSLSSIILSTASRIPFNAFPSKSTPQITSETSPASRFRRSSSPKNFPNPTSPGAPHARDSDPSPRAKLTAPGFLAHKSRSGDPSFGRDLRTCPLQRLSTYSEPSARRNPPPDPRRPSGTEEECLQRDLGAWTLGQDGVILSEDARSPASLPTSAPGRVPLPARAVDAEASTTVLTPARGSHPQPSMSSAGSGASFFSTVSNSQEDTMTNKTISYPRSPHLAGEPAYRPALPRMGSNSVLPSLTMRMTEQSRVPEFERLSRAEPAPRRPFTADGGRGGGSMESSLSALSLADSDPSVPIRTTSFSMEHIGPWSSPHQGYSPNITSPLDAAFHPESPPSARTQRLRTPTEDSSNSSVKTLNIQYQVRHTSLPFSPASSKSISEQGHQEADGVRSRNSASSALGAHPSRRPSGYEEDFNDPMLNTPSIRLVSPISSSDAPPYPLQPRSQLPLHPTMALSPVSSNPSSHSLPSPNAFSSCLTSPVHRETGRPNPELVSPSSLFTGVVAPEGHPSRNVGLGLEMERHEYHPYGKPNAGRQRERGEEDLNEDERSGISSSRSPSMKRDYALPASAASSSSTFSAMVSGPTNPSETSIPTSDARSLSGFRTKNRTISITSTKNSTRRVPHSGPHTPSQPPHPHPVLDMKEQAKRLARQCWEEDESVFKREKLAEWLGSPESTEEGLPCLTLKYYMRCFDFERLRIDFAFRKLCMKLFLKGETQQVDRILIEFSKRFWEQNASNLYFSIGESFFFFRPYS